MTNAVAEIPERLEDLLGFSTACGCGRVHAVEMRGASVRAGAIEEVVDWAREVGSRLGLLVVADRITQQIAADRVEGLLRTEGHRVDVCILPNGAGGRPHADETTLQVVEQALEGRQLAVAVGSGTVSDLTKLASFRRKIPYLAVATAPSMNGYTSAIAAVMIQGVKRTLECHQPLAVLADLEVIRTAPAELVAAGLGDLESKPTATADFRLSGWVRGEYHCPAPEAVVMRAEARVADAALGLAHGDPKALLLLTEALLLSGISMKLAGSSSPASGGEHLISHFWDMTAAEQGRVEGWHGAQVGVATLLTATLYERLGEISPSELDVESLVQREPSAEEWKERIRRIHGVRADQVVSEFFQKRLDPADLRAELEKIKNGWDTLWKNLSDVLRPAGRIRSILSAAAAPTTAGELGLGPDHLRRGLLLAREIRGRFTVLDLAAELSLLEPLAEDVLHESGCLGS